MKKKILVIDDEAPITKLLKYALEKTGSYDVAMENNSAAAMQAIRNAKPDLLILDINMPGTNGGEIAAQLKEEDAFKHLPIIFLTGNVSPEEVEQGITISGHPALAKPIDLPKLIDLIRRSI